MPWAENRHHPVLHTFFREFYQFPLSLPGEKTFFDVGPPKTLLVLQKSQLNRMNFSTTNFQMRRQLPVFAILNFRFRSTTASHQQNGQVDNE